MRQRYEIGIVIAACVFVTGLFVYILYGNYQQQRKKIIQSANVIFKEAVAIDRNVRLKDVPYHIKYDSYKTPNEVPFNEILSCFDQSYIFAKDSNRLSLDSTFHTELAANRIEVKSAVSMLYKCKMHYSLFSYAAIPDSSGAEAVQSPIYGFYKRAVALDPYVCRMTNRAEDRLELRGYILIPPLFVIKSMQLFYPMLFLWFMIIAVMIGIYCFRQKVKIKGQEEPLGKHTLITPDPVLEWMDITSDLLFNKRFGYLKQGDRQSKLIGNSLNLFILLLEKSDHFISYEEICTKVLHRNMKNGLSESDQNAVFTTVRRLRESLKPFPSVKIESASKQGYLLVLSFVEK